ncbi:MAG: RDD family protein [Bacteroidota bacterium]
MSQEKYAGFWLRFVALLIDGIILYVISSFIFIPLLAAVGLSFGAMTDGFDINELSEGDIVTLATTFITAVAIGNVIGLVVRVLYYTFMESSKYQATVGKLALGLKVTDAQGQKLDFVKAFIRQLGKIVSGFILLIGYIMAAFTEKKQALHDMIAGTLVVKK